MLNLIAKWSKYGYQFSKNNNILTFRKDFVNNAHISTDYIEFYLTTKYIRTYNKYKDDERGLLIDPITQSLIQEMRGELKWD